MSKKVDITKILEVVPALSPIAEYIDHVEIGEWKDVNKWDRPEKGEAKRLEETEPRLTVWLPLKDINLDILNRMKNADNTPRVVLKRDDEGAVRMVKYPYDNPKTNRRSWSPKVQGFFLPGDDYKQFRDYAPLVVLALIRMGLIK
jgi:hypothetical protein